MRPYSFHPEALIETDEAAKFYEERQAGLGNRFIESLTDALNRIRRNPIRYRKIYNNIRKCHMLRFPYGVIFRDQKEMVQIIAVMHLKRKPGYWKSRI